MPLSDYLAPINHDFTERIQGCNPCDRCSLHIAACPWLHAGKPVPGWDAEPCLLPSHPRPVKTWHIRSCPLYRPPRPRKVVIPTVGQREMGGCYRDEREADK